MTKKSKKTHITYSGGTYFLSLRNGRVYMVYIYTRAQKYINAYIMARVNIYHTTYSRRYDYAATESVGNFTTGVVSIGAVPRRGGRSRGGPPGASHASQVGTR